MIGGETCEVLTEQEMWVHDHGPRLLTGQEPSSGTHHNNVAPTPVVQADAPIIVEGEQ